jgi:hypothetical protein
MGVRIQTIEAQEGALQSDAAGTALDGSNPSAIGVRSPELNGTKRSLDERTSPLGRQSH